ncbi:MAG TPA: hypothetical protein VLD40_06220 [Dissulfurispiraceae bacterium]|nr:hypothetical protein [Dissulfurispiraceae bacterium]
MGVPITIGIGGSESNTGKTTVASALLRLLTNTSPERLSGQGDNAPAVSLLCKLKRWGAVKYTRTVLYTSIVVDAAVLKRKGKDTRRLLDAGAEQVLWVQAPPSDLGDVLPMAVDKLSYLDGIIIEGNSAVEFLKPDIVIFLLGSSGTMKPSATHVLGRADIVVVSDEASSSPPVGTSPKRRENVLSSLRTPPRYLVHSTGKGFAGAEAQELLRLIEMTARKKEIERLLKEKSMDGNISCAVARAIAEDLGVSYRDVGIVANEVRIKIRECELGCF